MTAAGSSYTFQTRSDTFVQSGRAEWVWAGAVHGEGGRAGGWLAGLFVQVAGPLGPRSSEESTCLPPGAGQAPLTGRFCDLFW